MNKLSHYNEAYFNDFQMKIGQFGGVAELFKFQKHIRPTDFVMDYGCGGGFLINNIKCRKKLGFEINSSAINFIKENFNFKVVNKIDDIEDDSLNVIISNHCLEHVTNPIKILKDLKQKIKTNGKLIIYVPHDNSSCKFKVHDIDKHFYSFSPSNLGNILVESGYEIIDSGRLLHRWPPFYTIIYRIFGLNTFHFFSRLYGFVDRRRTQSYVLCIKI